MPNSNYIAGRNLEYRVMDYMHSEYDCDYVSRSAGSHSLFDVVAFNSFTGDIFFIQCKNGSSKIKDNDMRTISSMSSRMSPHNNDFMTVHFWQISKRGRGKPLNVEVIG